MSNTYEEYVDLCIQANDKFKDTVEGKAMIEEYGHLPGAMSREQWNDIYSNNRAVSSTSMENSQ